MRSLRAAAAGVAAAGAYALAESRAYRIETKAVPTAPGTPHLRLLHLSDTHLTAANHRLCRFLESLPEEMGALDLIAVTGDMIEDDSGIDPLLAALEGLRARLGVFYVLGSHDYFQARFKSPTKYLRSYTEPPRPHPADVERLEKGFEALGWTSLTNRTELIDTGSGMMRIAGVDDPYIKRQRTGHIERGASEVLAVGLTHAPDVVSDWVLNGFDLVLAGHTHGGQVRFPLVGAVVTNCSLPTELAMGLTRIGEGWLHVSPGMGTSRFTPIRFLCPPEATVLELEPSRV